MQREPGHGEDDPDAAEDEGHPPISLHLALAAPGVGLKARVLPVGERTINRTVDWRDL